jgi:hypothetical protein
VRGLVVTQHSGDGKAGQHFLRGWQHALFGKDSTTEAGLQPRHDHIGVGLFDSQARAVFQTVSNDHVDETATGCRPSFR